MQSDPNIPSFFVYGEPSRLLEVGFLHVEAVSDRKDIHFGKVRAHRHPHMGQITLWTQGSGHYRIEDTSWDFSAPAVSFVPSSIVHGFDVEPDADATVVSIADDMLKDLARQLQLSLDTPVFVAGQGESDSWRRLATVVETLASEYRDDAPLAGKLMPELAASALCYIARLNHSQPQAVGSPAVVLATALRGAVEAHYREAWLVDDYVAALATTPHLLDKAARQVLGMSVKDVVLERRLLEAKRLLMFTIRPVEDIAFETGFGDPAYFSRFFRRRCGEAPSTWRRRQIEAQ
ncbi:helix-turn-helix domain-containing protein [Aminobacter ciceronei]|uniref:AraC family transcriptional activator of pobA n=1 Tax=Aminobacter ciceronei TaxID=150723 RepID=A0ABR6CA31_9HYPH|nr:helix-turn-helix domain-containing protein [Aminobacter ciceronei]MBA8908132.1 AraC family transcriptional activator of pobA [Aminobacter ciceronei]MBA9021884.1 AraC family transcriptional activator of pobA [Aminobacter ciceronei]